MALPDDYLQMLVTHIERYVTLSKHEGELLAAVTTTKRVLRRQFLLQEGDICNHESFVVSGCLRRYFISSAGIEHTLSFAVENWWMSDLESLVHRQPTAYNIEAIENSIVLQIHRDQLQSLYDQSPMLERYFRLLHQNAYISLNRRILENISLPAADRYQSFLRLYPAWEQRIPQKHIASFLGITPVFLSQIRSGIAAGTPKN